MKIRLISIAAAFTFAVGCTPPGGTRLSPPAERAQILLERGLIAEAITALDEAVAAEPGNAKLLFRRAIAHEAAGDDEAAVRDYSAALRAEPTRSDALINRGTIRTRNGQLDEAVTDYTAAITADPDNGLAYANRAQALIDLGRGAEAATDLAVVENMNPGEAINALRLADVATQQRDFREAERWLEAARQRAVGDPEMLMRVAQSMAVANLIPEGAAVVREATAEDPAAANSALGRRLLRLGPPAAAVRDQMQKNAELADGAADLVVRVDGQVVAVFVADRDGQTAVVSADIRADEHAGGIVAWPKEDGVQLVPIDSLDTQSLPAASLRLGAATAAPAPLEAE